MIHTRCEIFGSTSSICAGHQRPPIHRGRCRTIVASCFPNQQRDTVREEIVQEPAECGLDGPVVTTDRTLRQEGSDPTTLCCFDFALSGSATAHKACVSLDLQSPASDPEIEEGRDKARRSSFSDLRAGPEPRTALWEGRGF
eukprot:556575-Rhodomonas_salina.3